MEKKYSIRQVAVIVAIAVVFSICITSIALYSFILMDNRYTISFDTDDVNYQNVRKFNIVRDILKSDYYKDVDENVLLEGATAGLAQSLDDPYTVYFDKDEMKSFMEKSEGSYVGIGVKVNTDENGILTVVEPFENSPAALAGLKKDDKIIKVDDTRVDSIGDENMIISMIKGKENTNVKITVYRPSDGKYYDFQITRKKIKTDNIKSKILDGDIGYIKLVMFDSQIYDYFQKELNSLIKKGVKGLIIDLRDNPGGSYEQVCKIADALLPESMIVYTEDRNGTKQEKHSDSKYVDLPLVLITNGNSASASEILAGAVKDNGRGTLVGTKTFGKGLVQELRMLEDGSGIKVTISRYFTPSGVCIHGTGIKPDVEIDVLSEYKDLPVSQIPEDKDVQLKSAIEEVRSKINAK